MTSKTPRICEHEERHIASILHWVRFTPPLDSSVYNNMRLSYVIKEDAAYKVTHYLNTKKKCKKCL